MKILLTGGAGFIGSCLLGKLNQKGVSDILVVDHLENSSKYRNLIGKKFKDCVEKNDFLKLILDKKIDKSIDMVIHLGACTSTILDDAIYFIKNNYEYSKELARWSLNHHIPFLYASSAATYGDGRMGFNDEDKATLGLKPLNIYAYSKQLFDLWIIKNKLSNEVIGFKFFNVFGPNEYHKGEMMSIIAKSFNKILKEGKIKLFKSYRGEYADGEQKRDFIYVKDAVEIIYYFIEHVDKKGIFNVGTGQARTWNELISYLFSALGMKPRIEYMEMPENLKDTYQYYTKANLSKLRKAGCQHKFFELKEAVEDYVGFLKTGSYL